MTATVAFAYVAAGFAALALYCHHRANIAASVWMRATARYLDEAIHTRDAELAQRVNDRPLEEFPLFKAWASNMRRATICCCIFAALSLWSGFVDFPW